MQNETMGARRSLVFDQNTETPGGDKQSHESEVGMTGDHSQALVPTPPLPANYVSPREAKKAKTTSSPKKQNTNKMALLAGSDAERRQAQ